MEKVLKIGIVDDHPIFRKGLNALISEIDNVQVVFEASNGQECISYIEFEKVDIIFMDIQMPILNGIEATKKALRINSNIKIIALSMYADKDYFEDMINAGAMGFLLKDAVSKEIVEAINTVKRNKNYFSEEIISFFTIKFVNDYLNKINKAPNLSNLDENELESIKQLCNSMAIHDITQTFYMTMVIKGMKKDRTKAYSLPKIVTRRIKDDWEKQDKPSRYN
jgi:DNA-binding NarL/FixJ family response regulator